MKNLRNLGKALSKAEQKQINGGGDPGCGPGPVISHEGQTCGGDNDTPCPGGQICCYGQCGYSS